MVMTTDVRIARWAAIVLFVAAAATWMAAPMWGHNVDRGGCAVVAPSADDTQSPDDVAPLIGASYTDHRWLRDGQLVAYSATEDSTAWNLPGCDTKGGK